jgi:hypothetical protein
VDNFMIMLIKPDGTKRIIGDVTGEPTLPQLYEWLECDTIEVPGGGFRTMGGEEVQFVVDETGKLTGKPVNAKATRAYDEVLTEDPRGLIPGRDELVGNVIILTEPHLLT